jgi:SAM-dependent methyltransferase
MKWKRTSPLGVDTESREEIWTRETDDGTQSFTVQVLFGKQTDLLKLKKDVISSLAETIAHHQKTRREAYSALQMEDVVLCPVCDTSSEHAKPRVIIHGASYVQCSYCSHVFVKKRPTSAAIGRFYLSDVNYAATYTDVLAAEQRLQTIAIPWHRWMTDTFHSVLGRNARSVFDVGCGAGHFIEACRREGMTARGNEISEVSRRFAREIWGIDLDGRDFCESAGSLGCADLVTFWGLLEHTPNPSEILRAARRVIGLNGMIVAKLPRWDSLSTAAQCASPDTTIRHLDPMGHIMCFTDASAAELFYRCGLKPVAAWYYGMDVYELLMQAGNVSGNHLSLTETNHFQIAVQSWCDTMCVADGLVIAAVPMEE